MTKTSSKIFAAAAFGAALLSVPGLAAAQSKKADLDEQPAVRHRLLLVAKRLEATPMFESTINADFRHFIGAGLKVEYHISDMLSFGGIGVFTTALDTKLTKRIKETLEDDVNDMTREPSLEQFDQRLNSMPLHGALYVSLTPWYGKLAAFGKAFVNFDFYFQGGFGFATLKSSCDEGICSDADPFGDTDPTMPGTQRDQDPNDDPPLNDGFRPGLYLGGGLHVFVSDFLAIDIAVRDYAFKDNPSGADFNADLAVGENPDPDIGDDNRFLHHLFVGVGVSVMLPFQVKRTH
jgi:outer membrane beta-barrel protein